MSSPIADPFRSTAQELQPHLRSSAPFFPELEAARATLDALRSAPQTQLVLGETEALMETIEQIPQTSYTLYRLFVRNGDRGGYETPYFNKRTRLAAAALRLFFGQPDLKDVVQDYLWDICEESNWVLPAHENRVIDLFSAETGFVLAEALCLLGETVDAEVRHRVRLEIERRIFDPYLRFHQSLGWYMGANNWNGVCNGAVAEMTLGEIILGVRRVFENAAANRAGPAAKPANLKILRESIIGVVGASEVGKRVIHLLQPFSCSILLYDPFVTAQQATAMGAQLMTDLADLCATSDVITLHTPALPQTKHIIGARELRAMRDDVIFINTARGHCVDEAALIAELEQGRLFALLDVSSPEPAPADSPLRRLPNVIYTSHIAGPASTNLGHQAVNDIAAFLQGGSPVAVVSEDTLVYTA